MAGGIIRATVDGREVSVESGSSILHGLEIVGVRLPTLCHRPRLRPVGSCRVCVVELVGSRLLVPACARSMEDGMKILTNSEKVVRARKVVLELLMSDHPAPCSLALSPSGCEIESHAAEYGVLASRFPSADRPSSVDYSNHGIVYDPSSCILCHRCIRACNELQVNEVIGLTGRGFETRISFDFDDPMGGSTCVTCGECASVCPTGALVEGSLLRDLGLKEQLEEI